MCVIISQIYECNYITTISVIRKHSCICGVKAHILCLLSWNRILFIKKTHIQRCKPHLFFIVLAHPMIVVDAAGCRSAVSTVDSLFGIEPAPVYNLVVHFWYLQVLVLFLRVSVLTLPNPVLSLGHDLYFPHFSELMHQNQPLWL